MAPRTIASGGDGIPRTGKLGSQGVWPCQKVSTSIQRLLCENRPRSPALEVLLSSPAMATSLDMEGNVPMKPSVALDLKRSAAREATGRFHAANPRVFGSVLHGADQDGSDLDLLVDALPGRHTVRPGRPASRAGSALGRSCRSADPRRSAPEGPRSGSGRGAARMSENRLADYLDHMRQAATDACHFDASMPALGQSGRNQDQKSRLFFRKAVAVHPFQWIHGKGRSPQIVINHIFGEGATVDEDYLRVDVPPTTA